jgi:hypothetical protein
MTRLKPRVMAELKQRSAVRELAELSLTAYLAGVCDALGIEREQWAGFEDSTGDVLLNPDEPPE